MPFQLVQTCRHFTAKVKKSQMLTPTSIVVEESTKCEINECARSKKKYFEVFTTNLLPTNFHHILQNEKLKTIKYIILLIFVFLSVQFNQYLVL